MGVDSGKAAITETKTGPERRTGIGGEENEMEMEREKEMEFQLLV